MATKERKPNKFGFTKVMDNKYFSSIFKILLAFEGIILALYMLNVGFHKAVNPVNFHINFIDLVLETGTLRTAILLSMPILLVAVGSTFNERAGVINIGVEGIMIWGAWAAAYMTILTGNPWMGVLGAIFMGTFMALLHAVFTITFRAEQIVTGVAINFLALGLTEVLTNLIWETSYSPRVDSPDRIDLFGIPVLGAFFKLLRFSTYYDVPILGNILKQLPDIMVAINNLNGMVYAAILLVPLCHIFLFKTSIGLRLRVIGENPQAAATAGISVHKYQYLAIILSGILAALGGAVLAFEVDSFKTDMVNGRGFMGLASMIFGKWSIIGSAFAALFFGFFFSLKFDLSINMPGFNVPNPFIQMIPPIVAILALAGFVGRARPPKGIGIPYDPSNEEG